MSQRELIRPFVWILLLLCCGCGREGEKQTNSAEQPRPTTADAEKPELATETPTSREHGNTPPPRPSLTPIEHDLLYVPENALGTAIVRPARLAKLPGVVDIPGADLAGRNPVKPSEIERAQIVLLPDSSRQWMTLGIVLEFSVDVPIDQITNWLSPGAERVENDKRLYWPQDSVSPVLAFPHEKTVLVGWGIAVSQMLSSSDHPHGNERFAQVFSRFDSEAQVVAAVDTDRLRHFLIGERWFRGLAELTQPVQTLGLSLNLSCPDGLRAFIEVKKADDLEQVTSKILNWLTGEVDNLATSLCRKLQPEYHDQVRSLAQTLTGLVDDLETDSRDSSLFITSNALPAAADSLRLVAESLNLYRATAHYEVARLKTKVMLRELGMALHNSHDMRGELPIDIVSSDGKPLLSWRVRLLPFLEQDVLFDQFRLDEPWDSPHNKQLIEPMPDVFRSRASSPGTHTTYFQGIRGKGTVMGDGVKSMSAITDGLPETLALVECDQPVVWTKPGDFEWDPTDPKKGLRTDGSLAAMYDVRIVQLSPDTDEDNLRRAFQYADGGKVDWEGLSGRPPYQDPQDLLLPPEKIDALLATLQGADEDRLKETLRQLRTAAPRFPQVQNQAVVAALLPHLDTDDPYLRRRLLETTVAWSAGATVELDRVEHLLQDDYEWNRWLTIQLLSNTRERNVARALLEVGPSDVYLSSQVLFEDFGGMIADAAVPLLKHADPQVRGFACGMMAADGDESHLPHIVGMLQDDDETCRKIAAQAIASLPELGPLQRAVKRHDGNLVAALNEVAVRVDLDANNEVIGLDLSDSGYPRRYEGDMRDSDVELIAGLKSLFRLKLKSSRISDKGLVHLRGLSQLQNLDLSHCPRITDKGVAILQHLNRLESLHIHRTHIGDEAARVIGKLQNLRTLWIGHTRLTDASVAHIARLPSLRELEIGETLISDEGMQALIDHPQLETLLISESGVSDKCIPILGTLKKLRHVNLRDTNITEDGKQELQRALPECNILN